MTSIWDRARGSFIGLAVGDAIGTTVEFKERGEFTPVTDMTGGGAFRLKAGEWTDDTSMAICLAENIIANNDVEPNDLLARFVRWYQQGENSSNGRCFDIGTTTREALQRYMNSGVYSPSPDRFHLAGNGSIMRLSPVAIRWWYDPVLAAEKAELQSLTTHGASQALAECGSLADFLARAISGNDEYDILHFRDEMKKLPMDRIPNSGYVEDTILAASWALSNTDNFNDCVLLASNLGGDADTIAAVAGQMAGALYGMESIREDWRKKLVRYDELVDMADKLYDAALAEKPEITD